MARGISQDEIDYFILRRCINQYEKAKSNEKTKDDKCAREIDLKKALAEITGELGTALENMASITINRLAPDLRPKVGPLCRCSNANLRGNKHASHVRAFINVHSKASRTPAWDRMSELEKKVMGDKELEQKFKILFSAPQMRKDFIQWTMNEKDTMKPLALIYIDIDDFKTTVNDKYGNSTVDRTLLPEFQELLKEKTASFGTAYRHGGEEFAVLLPNFDECKAKQFADEFCGTIEHRVFTIDDSEVRITVSIGVAIWPKNGKAYDKVLTAANNAEGKAKKEGKNRVLLAAE
jgi:diguanylate cyclase (GGDEF)-like protein